LDAFSRPAYHFPLLRIGAAGCFLRQASVFSSSESGRA